MALVVVRWARVDDAPLDDDALTTRERERNGRFHHDADRRRFVGVRLLLRATVAEVAGCAPAEVALEQRCARCAGAHGAPVVTIAGRSGPAVSMAHAADLAVVAVASIAVGIDVEPVDATVDTRRWVRGEAVLKMTGHGMAIDPALVDLSPSTAAPRLLGWRGPGRRPTVRLEDLTTEPGYVAAVARRGRRPLRIDSRASPLSPRP